MPSERHRFDVWSFIFGALFAVLAALTIWLPVEPGWAITIGRAMGPAILVLIGMDSSSSAVQAPPPHEAGPLPAEPLGRLSTWSMTWITPLPAMMSVSTTMASPTMTVSPSTVTGRSDPRRLRASSQ